MGKLKVVMKGVDNISWSQEASSRAFKRGFEFEKCGGILNDGAYNLSMTLGGDSDFWGTFNAEGIAGFYAALKLLVDNDPVLQKAVANQNEEKSMGKLTVVHNGIEKINWSQGKGDGGLEANFELINCGHKGVSYNLLIDYKNRGRFCETINKEGITGLFVALETLIMNSPVLTDALHKQRGL